MGEKPIGFSVCAALGEGGTLAFRLIITSCFLPNFPDTIKPTSHRTHRTTYQGSQEIYSQRKLISAHLSRFSPSNVHIFPDIFTYFFVIIKFLVKRRRASCIALDTLFQCDTVSYCTTMRLHLQATLHIMHPLLRRRTLTIACLLWHARIGGRRLMRLGETTREHF